MKLTNEQIYTIKKFDEFKHNKNDVFILNSRAGTGKTAILNEMFKGIEKETLFLGTTGRSIKIMKEKGLIYAQTIHSCIYKNPTYSVMEDTELSEYDIKVSFELKNIDDIKEFEKIKYILVDEASMLTDKNNNNETLEFGSGSVLSDLIKFAKSINSAIKFIFVGDDNQLPPVGDNKSKALDMIYLCEEHNLKAETNTLNKIHRQKEDTLIIENMLMISNLLAKPPNERIKLEFKTNDKDVIVIKEADIHNYYDSKTSDIIISLKNSKNDSYNKHIRFLNGYEKELEIGDKIIFTKNIYRDFYKCDILSGDFGIITKIGEKRTHHVLKKGNNYNLEFLYVHIFIDSSKTEVEGYIFLNALRNEEYNLSVFDQQLLYLDCILRFHEAKQNDPSYKEFKKDLEKYEERRIVFNQELDNYKKYINSNMTNKKDVEKFLRNKYKIGKIYKPTMGKYGINQEMSNFLLNDKFLNSIVAKYGNAITFYKAQGGEWENVFVDFEDVRDINDFNLRSIYTAISRATKKLYLINPLNINIFSKIKISAIKKIDYQPKYEIKSYTPSSEIFTELFNIIELAINNNNSQLLKVQEQQNQNRVIYFLNTSSNGSRLEIYFNKKGVSKCLTYSYLGDKDVKLTGILNFISNYKMEEQ